MIFEHTHCYFFRKPPEIASTRGKEQSFLDIVFEQKNDAHLAHTEGSREQVSHDQQQLFLVHMGALGIETCTSDAVDTLISQFDHESEYGLLNRLDTVTSGLLYFAKTPEIYQQRKDRQQDEKIEKYYLAKIKGELLTAKRGKSGEEDVGGLTINIPLGHHTNGKRMIVADDGLLHSKRKQKIKGGHLLPARTEIVKKIGLPPAVLPGQGEMSEGQRGLGHESKDEGHQTLLIKIYKGRRHQIRAHLTHIGHPILGEKLYNNDTNSHSHAYGNGNENQLELYSIGCKILA